MYYRAHRVKVWSEADSCTIEFIICSSELDKRNNGRLDDTTCYDTCAHVGIDLYPHWVDIKAYPTEIVKMLHFPFFNVSTPMQYQNELFRTADHILTIL
jgi:hypothetical protein